MGDEKREARATTTEPPDKPDEAGVGQPDADADGKPESADPRAEKKTPKGENL